MAQLMPWRARWWDCLISTAPAIANCFLTHSLARFLIASTSEAASEPSTIAGDGRGQKRFCPLLLLSDFLGRRLPLALPAEKSSLQARKWNSRDGFEVICVCLRLFGRSSRPGL